MKKILTLASAWCITSVAMAQVTLPQLKVEDFMEGFTQPLGIENCGDSRLFIVEQGGKIWITNPDGQKLAVPYLDISNKVYTEGDEQGLLGLTFDPDYATNGYFYVNYTSKTKGNTSISRFTVNPMNPNKADKNTELVLLRVKQPFENHNGGQLRFGPDGYLYIGLGDGGDGGDPFMNAQDPTVLLGKMLRIDVHGDMPYSIPDSNPYKYTAGYKPEIYALGLRNPWRFSFDDLTGDLWLADVGQDKYEEINFQAGMTAGGQNYGWDCKEGKHRFEPENCSPSDNLTNPIVEYPHMGGDCTVVGGFVYRGTMYPNMMGNYFYVDYCSGKFRMVYKTGDMWHNEQLLEADPFEYVTFGEDMYGELYVADIVGGEIYKLIDTTVARIGMISDDPNTVLAPNPGNGQFNLKWIASENGTSTISIMNNVGQILSTNSVAVSTGVNEWTNSNTNLASGSYILLLTSKQGVTRKQFIVN